MSTDAGSPLLLEYLPTGSAVTVATVLASFVVLIFGEIVPKSYGLGNARRWAIVVVFDAITRRMNAVICGTVEIEKP